MARLTARVRTPPGGSRRGRRDQRAAAVVQLAVLAPVLLLLVTGSVQAALWQEADHVALAAAQRGLIAARGLGGSPTAGETTAREAAAQLGSGVLVSPSATVTMSGGEVTVTVTGTAEQLVPGLHLAVTDSASGPAEALP
jgi:Flp pilus assembly protein TadG